MRDAWRFVALAVLLLTVGACRRESAEQALRAQVTRVEQAVQAREPAVLREALADDFVGNDGLDREGAVRMAQLSFLRYRDVGVALGPMTVEVRGERASVRFSAVLTGGDGLLPRAGQAYDVVTGWRFEDGEWRLVSAEWTPRL
ncbi:MAG TPA: nuclear transport factor 2 family protein [Lysobacter sp.]|nr:nuclear transport factor 2 family protein [Lysobacter sp.]